MMYLGTMVGSVSNARNSIYIGYQLRPCHLSTALQKSAVPRSAVLTSQLVVWCAGASHEASARVLSCLILNAHNAVILQS